MDTNPDLTVPTRAEVLSALRQIRLRQAVRGRHTPLLDVLHAWAPQPLRPSHHLLSARAKALLVPDQIAQLSGAGRAALERLTALAQTPDWPSLARRPYDARELKRHVPPR